MKIFFCILNIFYFLHYLAYFYLCEHADKNIRDGEGESR